MTRHRALLAVIFALAIAACGGETPVYVPVPIADTGADASGDSGGTDADEDTADPDADEDIADPDADEDTADADEDTADPDAGEDTVDPDADEDTADPDAGDTDQTDTTGPTCGDNTADDGEACDGEDLRERTCVLLGYDSGTLACADDCRDFDTSDCQTDCVPACDDRACGPDPECGISCGTCGEGACVDGTCVGVSDAAPRIITFNTNVRDVTEFESVIFTAVVTDPDGIDDLIGGTLIDPVTEASYGAFATAASEGAYSIELTWGAMHRVRAIDFLGGESTRQFEAEFFDVAGNRASARIGISLHCDGDAACDGTCTDITTESDCGACDNECPDTATCEDGACACPDGEAVCDGECVDITTVDACGACDNACPSGASCTEDGCACPDGWGVCDDICTDLSTLTDCGECDNACIDGASCTEDGCACPAFEAECDGACRPINTVTDCGTCDAACPIGASCAGGDCECPDGYGVCDGACTNLGSTSNCGRCGVACLEGQVCDSGACRCPGGEALCDDVCTSITRPENCGECGNVCPEGASCVDGSCRCPGGQIDCDGVCVDSTTTTNCGECGNVCLPGAACVGGECACGPGEDVCDDACVDITTDERCGDCENACPDGDGWTCLDGASCGCEPGLHSCGPECATFYEADNCGGLCADCADWTWCGGWDCLRPVTHDLRINDHGNLEIYAEDQWGIVCDDGFDAAAADVACAQLGGAAHSWEGGQTDTNTVAWLDSVDCAGDEDWLMGCVVSDITAPSCDPATSAVRLLCQPTSLRPECTPHSVGSVVINEVFAADGEPDWVELATAPNAPVGGLTILGVDGPTGAVTARWVIEPGSYADEDGLFLVGNSGGGTRDLYFEGALPPVTGGIVLEACDRDRVDAFAYGYALTNRYYAAPGEGDHQLALSAATSSWARDVDSTDTDDNRDDFTEFLTPTPGFPNSPEIIPLDLPLSWNGSLPDSPTFHRPDGSCDRTRTTYQSPYLVREITNRTTDTYYLQLTGRMETWQSTGDGWGGMELRLSSSVIVVYLDEFDPTAPLVNCTGTQYGSYPVVNFDLAPGRTAYLVMASPGTYDVPVWSMTVSER